jgi:hypothetical protein
MTGPPHEEAARGLSKSKKWRDLQANPKAAFVVDDLESVNPWTPGGIEIVASPRCTAKAARSASEKAAGTRPGSPSCRSG